MYRYLTYYIHLELVKFKQSVFRLYILVVPQRLQVRFGLFIFGNKMTIP